MNTKYVGFRATEELLNNVDDWAADNTGGNRSAAITEILTRYFDRESDSQILENIIEKKMNELLDKVVRVSSRGTKAALGNMFLCSSLIPSLSQSVEELGYMLSTAISSSGTPLDTDEFDSSVEPFSVWKGLGPEEAFAISWKAGGRLQSSRNNVAYNTAKKDLFSFFQDPGKEVASPVAFWSDRYE